ncbi:cation transporter HKT2;1-like [Typha latifolia]|uniref:cation transporter HKT2;1-like n=1 Tax=Typha latifolia TaxID=4733 RepID=UPI003C2D0678
MAFSLAQTKSCAYAFILNRTQSFTRASKYVCKCVAFSYRFSAFHFDPFWIHLCYFVFIGLFGSLLMMILKPSNHEEPSPRYVDMLFMSMSALTVSGLGTIEMENLSSSQIVVLTLLMLVGGEVFVSLMGLLLRRGKSNRAELADSRVDSVGTIDHIESGLDVVVLDGSSHGSKDLRHRCVQYLGLVVLGYILLILVAGSVFVLLYVTLVSSSRDVLKRKGIHVVLFSISVTVSSFANGGLIPTNENMAIFGKNSGLLLLLIPQILAGNTLFPLFLRLVIWALRRITKAEEFKYMLANTREIKFSHLHPNLRTTFLLLTVIGFIAATVALFCSMDWNSAVFDGLNSYQKIVSALFMAANTRHAGENSIDCSLVSPAVLVLFIVMMYFPSSTSFSPIQEEDASPTGNNNEEKRSSVMQYLILPQLSCVIIFVICICISERRRLSRDPLNFSTLNMIFEVISAYGNVGLSTGYSCSRLLKLHPESICVDKTYSFSGWWSDEGKLILVLVMLYGRLKKFSMGIGQA